MKNVIDYANIYNERGVSCRYPGAVPLRVGKKTALRFSASRSHEIAIEPGLTGTQPAATSPSLFPAISTYLLFMQKGWKPLYGNDPGKRAATEQPVRGP